MGVINAKSKLGPDCFSDEFTIRLGPVKRRQWQLKEFRKVFRTIKYPGTVNVWDCFAPRGFGQI
ncbi:unnamed protein product, partial [Rotaria sordida]